LACYLMPLQVFKTAVRLSVFHSKIVSNSCSF
jgi:hypothetical protein